MPLAPQAFEGHIFLLHCPTLIDVIVDNFYQSAGKKNLRGDAAAMMSPALVERMKALKQIIIAHFSE